MFVPLPSPEEMSRWDAGALALGVPEAVLMENAAREALAMLRKHYGPLAGARVLLLAGGGNNGGDASCLARHLHDTGAFPVLAMTRMLSPDQGAAGAFLALARELGVPCDLLPEEPEYIRGRLESYAGLWADEIWLQDRRLDPDIIVDGLLGTGFTGELRPREKALVEAANSLAPDAFRLALDVPSGLNALSGQPGPVALRADLTVTFQAAKPGLILPEALPWTGVVEVRPIGMPLAAQRAHPAGFRLWLDEAEDGRRDVLDPYTVHGNTGRGLPGSGVSGRRGHVGPDPAGPRHKGEAGRVLILGGSPGMSGAPRLACQGAVRAGAGLVCVAAPEACMQDIRLGQPEAITLSLPPAERGRIWPAGLPRELRRSLPQYRALVLGPGMGRDNGSSEFLQSLLAETDRPPAVLDADALTALAGNPKLLSLLRESDILTPHPGEAGLLLGQDAARVQTARLETLAALADRARAVWVLKGAGSLVHEPGKPATIFATHVPTLAVGGSGDVLAGLIAALVARGLASGLAAVLGVHLHLQAGLLLGERFPRRGNTPSDIAEALPHVLHLLDQLTQGRERV